MARSFRDCARDVGLSDEVESFLAGDGDPGATDTFRRELGEKHQEALIKKYQSELQAISLDDAVNKIEADPRGARDAARAYYTVDDRRVGHIGVEQEILARQNYYMAQFSDAIETAQAGSLPAKLWKTGATQDQNFGRNVAREAMGKNTGDVNAKAAAEQFGKIAEDIRLAFNHAGGNIKKLDTWAMPQRHSAGRILQGGAKGKIDNPTMARNQWVEFITPLIRPFTDADGRALNTLQTKEILESSFDAITTNGASRREPSQIMSASKLANRHQESRAFHFADSDAWLKYADEYGDGDVMGSMIQHIQDRAGDLGLLEAMGPNPDAVHRAIRGMVQHQQDMAPGKWKGMGVNNIDNIWMNITGMDKSGSRLGGQIGGIVRSHASAAKLGGAFVSSIPDPAYSATSVMFNGTGVGRWGKHWVRQFVPGLRKQDVKAAKSMGYMVDQVVDEIRGVQRHMDPEISNAYRNLNTRLYKASLLTPWDRGNRTAFKMSLVDGVSSAVGRDMNQANSRLQYMMKRAGIDEGDWANLRAARNDTYGGLIDLTRITDPALVRKWGGLVETEVAGAVITPTARTQAVMNQGLATGTAGGEAMRFMMQWKSHPIAYGQTQLARMMNTMIGRHGELGAGFATAYAAQGIVSLGVLGMMTVQAKELTKGRTPLPMDSGSDWFKLTTAGLIQAGAGGLWYETIYGALFNGMNPAGVLAPPALQMFDDLLGVGIFADVDDDGMAALDGRLSELAGGTLVRTMGWVPGQSLWYLRSAWEQVAIQGVADAVSPEEAKKMKARSRRLKRDRGQEEFWR